jgi:hypothetical protein
VSEEMERKHLAQANRQIEEATQRIVRQERLIAELERRGRDTTTARQLLTLFEETLGIMVEHRVMILRALDRAAMQGVNGRE